MLSNVLNKKRYSYVFSVFTVFLFSILAYLLSLIILPKTGILIILQLAVVVVSISSNRIATTLAGVVCALVFNYFFTHPLYSLHMTNAEDIINTIIFIVVAMLTSEFSIRYRKKSEALEQAEIRSNILLSVSHDLRTPLANIIGSLSTFKEYKEKINNKEKDLLINSAIDESHRLHNYVENILQLTRIKNNTFNCYFVAQSIWPVIKKVEARFISSRLITTKADDLPQVLIQESLLEQAIYNIVDNGLKYSPKHSQVMLTVNCDSQFMSIVISDNGPGIAKDKLPIIFDLFYSTRIGDTGEGGAGIGLTVAKGIVEAHNGTITAKASDTGCTIHIKLPLGDEHATA
ncbi:ATP-binding protein [Pseudocolwellia sp. AS88]|uniref:sensor histidine kinase n=1 Tax=Pseudocolwellia sp. AS88 TaxID=3063958 RepID=UPI0026EB5641|nr:ATP-binding protein [Pseudocolwellia sp. AS88]MDO7083354.1 ATP-binding protein [Pseudocolwellia sp. AS88]